MADHTIAKTSLLLGLLFTTIISIAQKQGQERIDFLKAELKNYHSPCNNPCLNDSIKVNNLIDLAAQFIIINPDTAFLLINEALALSTQISWKTGVGRALHQKGNYYYARADYVTAISYYNSAIENWSMIEKQIPKTDWTPFEVRKAKAQNMIGNIYTEQGNYSKAIDVYLLSRKIFEIAKDSIMLSQTLGSLASVYSSMNQFAIAENYFLSSLQISEAKGDLYSTATTAGNLANAYYKQGKYAEALKFSTKALETSDQMGDMRGKSYALAVIGSTYQELKEFDKALAYYNQAKLITDNLNDDFLGNTLLVNMGSVHLFKNQYNEAELYLKNALSLAEKNSNLNLQKEAHGFLATLYIEKGNYKEAIEHFRKEVNAKDSLFNEEKTKEITRLEMAYAFEKQKDSIKVEQDKKDIEAATLLDRQRLISKSITAGGAIILFSGIFSFFFYKRKRDAEQKQKETLLSLQVSETEMKALRSQMNPHFIFNALQSIQTFLLSHKSEEANLYLLKFSKLMRGVLENSQHSEVPLKDDLQVLELYMQLESIRLPHPFTYKFHIDQCVDTETDSLPPLILQPFVENAIWHGLQYKDGPGHINIFISKKDNALFATVEDNGVGRDMSKQVAQPMLLKKESLGMKLTEERLKILNEVKNTNAKFTISDLFTKENKPSGTKVELSLPLLA